MSAAAERIRALVSGFPGERAKARVLLMLQAYVDGSGTGDSRFLVIAGHVATSEDWAKFSDAWEARLKCAQLPYFKMNEMKNKPEIAGWFYRLIEEHNIPAAIACVVKTNEIREVELSVKFPDYITNPNSAINPYFWAVKYIVRILAEYQEQLGFYEPVDFVFDTESEYERVQSSWNILKGAAEPKIAKLLGDTPIYRNDKNTMPLQAADLYAWWILKWVREGVPNWQKDFPFPWEKKRNLKRLSAMFGRNSALFDISKMLEDRARNQEEREYAVSLMPPESAWET